MKATITFTATDGSVSTIDLFDQAYTDAAVAAALAAVPASTGTVSTEEVAKIEGEVAAIDAELKADAAVA